MNPIGLFSCYDGANKIAKTVYFDYQSMHGTEIRVMRIFNNYGARILPDDGRVVSNFIAQAMCGEPVSLYIYGSQTQSFCYVII